MTRARKHPSLTSKIVRLQNAIRQKYKAFKSGLTFNDQILEKQYKPLITELRNINNKRQTNNTFIKKEELKEEEPMEIDERQYDFFNNIEPERISTPRDNTSLVLQRRNRTIPSSHTPVTPSFVDDGDIYGSSEEQPSVSEIVKSNVQETTQYVMEHFQNPITRKYMLKFFKAESEGKTTMDHIYGPRIDENKLVIGNQVLQFDEDGSIRINNISYGASEGLYELLFKRLPDENLYTENDLKTYKEILIKTNAHKKNYNFNGNINRINTIKYKSIISELFPKQLYGGKGLKNTKTRDIAYWDNPNELCTRLRLIVASSAAGNNNHQNEIQNIIEELKESKYISGSGNSIYKKLIGYRL